MTATPTLRRTPLYDTHKALGAKLVPFAGWEMPVQYAGGILAEHHAVRTGAGIFDVSHMGEFEVTGPDRNAFVNRITCNDVSALEPGGVQYSAILTPEGTFVDDCTVYRFEDKLMIVVNASNMREGLGAHRQAEGRGQRPAQGHLGRRRPDRAAGPRRRGAAPAAHRHPARRHRLLPFDVGRSRARSASSPAPATPARTASSSTAASATPSPSGTRSPRPAPAHRARRPRFAAAGVGYALYGNDIDETITPLEAGLGWIVKLDKGSPFMGDEALRQQKSAASPGNWSASGSTAAASRAMATRCSVTAGRWTSSGAAR